VDRAFVASDWDPLGLKVVKRAEPWMGKFLSSMTRLILINTCLSNLLMHATAVCQLGNAVHKVFNKHCSRFF
jgi:hypothetical protein